MKKIISTFTFSCLSCFAFCQDGNSGIPNNFNSVLTFKLNPLKKNTLVYEEIKGTPYYGKDFEMAKINQTNTVQARYNAYTDEIEFRKDDETFVLPKEEALSDIYFPAKKIKIKYLNTNDELSGYFFELSSGKYMLFKKNKIVFVDAIKASSGYKEDEPASFEPIEPKYYIRTENGFIKNPKNQKEIIAQIPDKKVAIEEFVKSNKIKFNKEEDLIRLVDFLNK